MHPAIRSIAAVIVIAVCSPAQDEPDSLIFALPDVIVQASGISEHAKRSASFTSSMTGTDLTHLSGAPIDRVLRRSGLVHVRDRGGRSSVSTIGLRGNPASHTTITLDGFPLVDEQNGVVDIGLYPLEVLQGISIVRGSQSPFAGSGGMGGAIQLRTGDPRSPVWGLEGSFGSFGSASGTVRLPLFGMGVPVTLHAGMASEKGEFSYDVETPSGHRSGTRLRNNADMVYLLAQSQQEVSDRTTLHGMVYLVDAERGSPGPVSLTEPADATLYDAMIRAGVRVVHATDLILWEGHVSAHNHRQRYQDRSPIFSFEDSYSNAGVTGRISGTAAFSEATSATIGAEAARHVLTATSVSFPEGSTRGAAFLSLTQRLRSTKTTIYPSVRLDGFSDLTPILSWKIAMHQPVLSSDLLSVRLGIGSGFRMPSFNERFWVGGGNPDLRHEQSMMLEGGVASRFRILGTHDAMLLLHLSEARDMIVGWPPMNADRSRLKGLEISWSWSPDRMIALAANVSYADVESLSPALPGKQLPFVPRITASGILSFRLPVGSASMGIEHVSRRYETLDNLETQSGAPYTLMSASLAVPFSMMGATWQALCFLDNVLDRSYEIVSGYPMPGRTVRVTMSMEVR